MPWTAPNASDFKAFFLRDFNFASETDQSNLELVLDADINKAITNALIQFDSNLFGGGAQATQIFLYLTAFYMVESIRLSTKGLASQVKFPIEANTVGGVNVSFNIPEKIKKSPILSSYLTNGYGQMYLQMALPFTVGRVRLAHETTSPQ